MTSYNRFDPAKGYTEHIFHADRVAQSAEPNEMQAQANYRLRRVAEAMLAEVERIAIGRGACKPFGRLNVKLSEDDELGSFIFRTTAQWPRPI